MVRGPIHGDKGAYGGLLKDIQKRHQIKRVKDYPCEGWICYLYHDVDSDINGAIRMAQIEADLGIASTYYILPSAQYFSTCENKVRYIQSLGHEVGLHHTLVTDYTFKYFPRKPLSDILEENLSMMRGIGVEVETLSAHGDAYCRPLKYSNYHAFRECPPEMGRIMNVETISLGNLRAVDFLPRDLFIWDSGAYWKSSVTPHVNDWNGVSDKWSKSDPRIRRLSRFDAEQIFILTHPRWWNLYEG